MWDGDPSSGPPAGYQTRDATVPETESRRTRIKKVLFATAVLVGCVAALYVLIAGV
jgi:hypothetical protein